MSVENLKAEVLKMSFLERLTFVQFIVDTMTQEAVVSEEPELSVEWKTELDRRSELYKSGKAETVSWAEIKEGIVSKNKN